MWSCQFCSSHSPSAFTVVLKTSDFQCLLGGTADLHLYQPRWSSFNRKSSCLFRSQMSLICRFLQLDCWGATCLSLCVCSCVQGLGASHFTVEQMMWKMCSFNESVCPLQVVGGAWLFSRLYCNIFVTLDVMMCTASILNLCAISIDRWVCNLCVCVCMHACVYTILFCWNTDLSL